MSCVVLRRNRGHLPFCCRWLRTYGLYRQRRGKREYYKILASNAAVHDARTTIPTSSSKATKRRTRFGEIYRTIGDGMLNPSKAPKLCREALHLLQEEGEIVFSPFRDNLSPTTHSKSASATLVMSRAQKSLHLWRWMRNVCGWNGNDSCELPQKEELARRPESHRLAFQTKKWSSAGSNSCSSSSSSSKIAAFPYSDEWLWRRAG